MQYRSSITWNRNDSVFNAKSYDRSHHIQFGGGLSVDASSAPEFLGNAKLPNPEELFTASLSSCFMLTFLYLAAMKGLTIDAYQADAIGVLAKNSEGKMAMTDVTIKPQIQFGGDTQPDINLLQELFKKAHEQCFISSSVKTVVKVEYDKVSA